MASACSIVRQTSRAAAEAGDDLGRIAGEAASPACNGPGAAARRPSSTGRWRRRGGGRSPSPGRWSSRVIAQCSMHGRPTKLTMPGAARDMVERGELAVIGAVVEPHAGRGAAGADEEEGEAGEAEDPREAQTSPLREADRDQRDREQIGREPHVGISRAEHDPRKQHEDDRQEKGRGGEVARKGEPAADQRRTAGAT